MPIFFPISLFNQGGVTGGGGGGGGTDPNFSTVKLLMGMDGSNGGTTFTDESTSPVTFSVGGGSPTTSTLQKKFGTASLRCSGSYITTPGTSPKWDPGSSDFTIEFWAAHDNTNDASNRGYIQWGGNPTIAISRLGASGGTWEFYVRTASQGSMGGQSTTSGGVTANVFRHICAERSGGTFRGYVDGTMVWKSTGLSGALESPSTMQIGQNVNGAHLGYIDEVRISHMARYNSDAGFTAPSSAFPRS